MIAAIENIIVAVRVISKASRHASAPLSCGPVEVDLEFHVARN